MRILDFGANDHVSSSLNIFNSYYKIKPIKISFRNGSYNLVYYAGNMSFSFIFYLNHVLYALNFNLKPYFYLKNFSRFKMIYYFVC